MAWKAFRRRRLGVAAAVLVLAGAAGGYAWWRRAHRAPEGFCIGLYAVDANSALVLWRANYDSDPSRAWIARIDTRGGIRWRRELPGLSPVATYDGLAVGEGVVAVRYSTDRVHWEEPNHVAAYALEDGGSRWDQALPAKGDTLYASSLFASGILYEWSDGVVALDPKDGRVLGRQRATQNPRAPLVSGDRVVTHDEHVTLLAARASSQDTLSAEGVGCVVGGEYVNLTTLDGQTALVGLPGGAPSKARVIANPFLPDLKGYFRLKSCGQFAGHLVFHLASEGQRTLVVITDDKGVPLHTVPLEPDLGEDLDVSSYPETAPLSGSLTRFTPYILIGSASEHAKIEGHVVMLDLEQGRVAWQSPDIYESLLGSNLFRAGDRWLLSLGHSRVMMFNGATGQLDAAAHTNHRVDTVRPYAVANGRLWLFAQDWSRLDHAPLVILEVATLKAVLEQGILVSDATTEARATLGLR
jgi:hypothetical protein